VSIWSKIATSVARRGPGGAVRHAFASLKYRLFELTPARRRARAKKDAIDLAFDARFGVDTAGIIPLSRLGIESENRVLGVNYWAIDPEEFPPFVEATGAHYPDYHFVDFGSGKGRALLLASEFPFKKVIGVEFSKDLVRIAQENLGRYPQERRRCKDVEVLCMDATQYVLPEEPLVLYFFNPFERPLMARMVERIAASHAKCPRDIRVIYANPVADDVWAAAPFLVKVRGTSHYSIYRTR
jgi:SAM-dependent methyltransferase